ncbi:MAG: sulfite reductase subunit alpha [Xanthomonadaceae bacterium]|jgi:sulfite reductase (NADPH) flavoprotein alpha-component|nr:sulfite reductase subunit alpha [Xanthomonadaceae bacterium]
MSNEQPSRGQHSALPFIIGNLIVIAALCGIALTLLQLHNGSWWIGHPPAYRWAIAITGLSIYLFASIVLFRRSRRQHDSGQGSHRAILVIWASQHGYARELAGHTTKMLQEAGKPVHALPLDQVTVKVLSKASHALFITSTTGQGAPPDHAVQFVQKIMQYPVSLKNLHYAVLALGNREYGNFCAFGHYVDSWLRQCNAQILFDLIEVDDIDNDAIRHWQYKVSHFAGIIDQPDWTPAVYQDWQLVERHELNPGSAGNPVFHIALRPASGSMPTWQAGDIVEISPRNSPQAVQTFLDASRLDGNQNIEIGGRTVTLSQALACSHLPESETAVETDAQTLAKSLHALPHREYSIASLPEENALWLLVRRMTYPDGRPGLGSGWLCDFAPIGSSLALRLCSNVIPALPSSDHPLILIGNGTGIASLRAHIRARINSGARRNWLLFGERNADRDFFYRDEIHTWQQQGWLERVDLAFSRDDSKEPYVQDKLRAASDTLKTWLSENAFIYVCGSLEGMAPGVDSVLDEVLGKSNKEKLLAEGRYHRDVY